MAMVYETDNFLVRSANHPHVSREEGGHILIKSKDEAITDRTVLAPKVAIELMRLSMIVGEAYQTAMNNLGIKVVKINYQDMGNWAYKEGKQPVLHYNIYGRTTEAVKQPFPDAVQLPYWTTGFYDSFVPLSDDDCREIAKQIAIVSGQDKYRLELWGMK